MFLLIIVSSVYEDGTVCISILVGWHSILYLTSYLSHRHAPSMLQEMISMATRMPVNAGCLFTP